MPGPTDSSQDADFQNLLRQTWVDNRMERDRSILTISSGGIGLLLTLSTTSGIHGTKEFLLYIGSLVAFTIAVIAAVVIFTKNSDYAEAVLSGGDKKKKAIGCILRCFDHVLVWSFIAGICFATLFTVKKARDAYNAPPAQEERTSSHGQK